MAFWNRRETRATSGLRYPSDWLTDSLTYGRASSAGTRVSVNTALGLSPVWAATKIISESVGQLPFKVYRDTGDGEKEEARTHRAWRLLHDRPNSQTPAGRFWASVSMLGLGSRPVTVPSGPTSCAISAARKPGPDPKSRTSSPRRRARTRSVVRRWSTTSGVV